MNKKTWPHPSVLRQSLSVDQVDLELTLQPGLATDLFVILLAQLQHVEITGVSHHTWHLLFSFVFRRCVAQAKGLSFAEGGLYSSCNPLRLHLNFLVAYALTGLGLYIP